MTGYDCSGFIQEVLASAGLDPPGDQTAQSLFEHFSKDGRWNRYQAGSLAFYGKDARHVTHVAMMIDKYRVIEAGGGGSNVTNTQAAARADAFIRVRHISHRKDLVAVLFPDYSTIGLY